MLITSCCSLTHTITLSLTHTNTRTDVRKFFHFYTYSHTTHYTPKHTFRPTPPQDTLFIEPASKPKRLGPPNARLPPMGIGNSQLFARLGPASRTGRRRQSVGKRQKKVFCVFAECLGACASVFVYTYVRTPFSHRAQAPTCGQVPGGKR
jgi:hypothetical protein